MSKQELSSLGFDNLDDLYKKVILDHYHHPRNPERLLSPEIEAHELNPFCGDEIHLQLSLKDGRIAQTGVQARGCSIIQASGSMMSQLLNGKTLDEVGVLKERFKTMMSGQETPRAGLADLGELPALAGIRRYPIRIKCALLPWTALEEGVWEYKKRQK